MNRLQFLKTLGISALASTVLTVYSEDKKEIVPIQKFNPKQWPIYPDKIQFSHFNYKWKELETAILTYVKIKRDGIYYLIQVKETCLGDDKKASKRFESNVSMVQDNFIVDPSNQYLFDNNFIIKYDKDIHK